MNEELSFNLLLDQNPEDHLTRLVYADWLQDHNDIRAAGYRRLGELYKYPIYDKHKGRIRPEVKDRLHDWGYSFEGNEGNGTVNCCLLEIWFRKMRELNKEDESITQWDWWMFFESRKQAEDAAAIAYYYL